MREGSTSTLTAIANGQGQAIFTDLLPGTYGLTAGRTLNASEVAALDGAGLKADALGAGAGVTVAAPSSAVTVSAHFGTRGSLVISEVAHSVIRDPAAGDYFAWQFIEIYNNADTTIYLDGKTVFKGLRGWWDIPDPNFGCSYYNTFNYDALGIWARFLYRFPGGGTTYPLAPGEVAVLATDAIDHSAIVAGGLDLSAVEFEFRGSADVDNPSVPNMLSIGPGDGGIVGNGLFQFENREVLGLAEHVDPAALPSAQIANHATPYARVPGVLVLDVVASRRKFQSDYAVCAESSVHPSFDQQDATLLARYDPNTGQRRVLLVTPNGRKVLQRTGTSAVDFAAGSPTPGSIP